jgi:uncharacterized membrane protein
MTDQKQWFMSKTVWGVLLMLASSVLASFGLELDAASQQQIVDLIMQAITVGGGALAVYGRVTAKTALK